MSTVTSDFEAFLGDDLVLEMPEAEEAVEEVEETEEEVFEEEEQLDEEMDEDEFDEDDDSDSDLDEEDVEDDEDTEVEEQADEFELTIDGELVKVTKEELSAGYLRNKDYMSKVAEAEERIERLRAEEETLLHSQRIFSFSSRKQLEEMEAAIQAEGGWLNIERSRDPVQVAQFKEMYQNVQNQAKYAEAVEAEYNAKQEKSFNEDMQKVAQHLIKTIPNVTEETFHEMDRYITEQGLTEDYAKTIRSPIAWTMIHKAMMYDKAQMRKVEEPKKVPKRVKKPVATRKENVSEGGRRKLDKTISEMKKTTDVGRQRELAVSAFSAFI